METLLSELALEEHSYIFKENGIELELLMDMSASELQDILKDIGFNLGNRWKIIKKIQKLRTESRYNNNISTPNTNIPITYISYNY